MHYSIRFVDGLKRYFDNISKNIWQDFEMNLLPGRTWREDDILHSSIIKDGFDSTEGKRILNDINANNPIYNIKVEVKDYGGKEPETITGADLAIVFQVELNKKPFSRRLTLVQLKRAYFDKGSTSFDELHHLSGKKLYGKDFHQAQRMLFFTSHSVYWLAMTSGILGDKASYELYSKTSTLKQALSSPAVFNTAISEFESEFSIIPARILLDALATLPTSDIAEMLYYYWDRSARPMYYHLAKSSSKEIEKEINYIKENLPYHYYQALQTSLEQASKQQVGMVNRLAALVCHAETVFGLSLSKHRSFADIYPPSIPFTDFMLRAIMGDEFGDRNESLIDAVLKNDVSGYFRERLEMFAKLYDSNVSQELEDYQAVKHSIVLTLTINTGGGVAQ